MNFKSIIFSTLLMSMTLVACAENPRTKASSTEWMLPDTIVTQQLGNSLTELIFSPKKVKCYHLLKKKDISEKDFQPIKGYVRDTLITTLSKSHEAVLQFLLLSNAKSYAEEIISIEAPHIPTLEFEFVGAKKKTASVIISMSDRSWTIIYDGKQQFNYNYVDALQVDRFCRYFVELYKKNNTKQ